MITRYQMFDALSAAVTGKMMTKEMADAIADVLIHPLFAFENIGDHRILPESSGGKAEGGEKGGVVVEYKLRPEVASFAALMEAELRKHDDRPGWKECDPFWLMRRLREELDELEGALLDHAESLPREAADVANFAMMIADVSGGLKVRPAPSPGPSENRSAENCSHANPLNGCDVCHGDCDPRSCADWSPIHPPGPLLKKAALSAPPTNRGNLDPDTMARGAVIAAKLAGRKPGVRIIEKPAPAPGPSAELRQVVDHLTRPLLSAEVEEAMRTLGMCLYGDKDGLEAMAVIRAALSSNAELVGRELAKKAIDDGGYLPPVAPPAATPTGREEMLFLIEKVERKLVLPQGKEIARKIRALILPPPSVTDETTYGKILFFDCISKPSDDPVRNCNECDHAVECDESCKSIEALILAPPILVTREWVELFVSKLQPYLDTTRWKQTSDAVMAAFSEKGIVVEVKT